MAKPSDFVIRPATPADVPVLVALFRELAEYEKLTHIFVVTNESLHACLFGDRPYAEALLGEFEGRPVGYAVFFHTFSTFLARPGLFIEDVYVQPSLRGRGFGTAFLRHLARIARQRNCARMDWMVLDWNAPSIEFYKRLGARHAAEWEPFRLEGEALDRMAEL